MATRARGEETPSESEFSGDDEEADEVKEEREITSSPTLHPLKSSPRLATSFVSTWGSLSAVTGQSASGRILGNCSARRRSLALCWYTLTCREHVFALVVTLITSLLGFCRFHHPCWPRGHCIHDGGAILIENRGCGALVQEGLPLVLPVGILLVSV
jgi:hypothetical protein